MRNGAGLYSLPAPPSPFVNGQTANATDVMTVLSDIATALTGSIAADGQTPITGTLNFGGNNATGVGALSGKSIALTAGATIGTTLAVTGATTLTDTLSVGGSATFNASAKFAAAVTTLSSLAVGTTLGVTGDTTLSAKLAVTGATTLSSTLAVTGTATAANGTSGSQVLNYSQFPTTTGATGTITFPAGLIRKWGSGSTTNGAGTVSFAAAFPAACDGVQITISGGTGQHTITTLIAGSVTASGFSVWGKAGENLSFYWEAVGR